MGNATQTAAQHYAPKFLRLKQVKARYGVSGSSIWSWVKQGKFPKPVKLSENTSAWVTEELDAHDEAIIEASK